jgi:hypothetical protein
VLIKPQARVRRESRCSSERPYQWDLARPRVIEVKVDAGVQTVRIELD